MGTLGAAHAAGELGNVIHGRRMMETNKELVRRFITEVWNDGDAEAADALIHAEYVIPMIGTSPEAVKRNMTAIRAAFPDMTWSIENIVAEGE